MSNPLDDEKAHFHVLVNSEGQHSLWPVFARVPAGWDVALKDAARSVCLEYIDTNWTDMRPESLKEAMKREGKNADLSIKERGNEGKLLAPRLG